MFGESRQYSWKSLLHPYDRRYGLLLFGILVGVFLIYQPALDGPFVFDDGPNLVKNDALHLTSLNPKAIGFALENVQAGPFGRPVAYASFALNYYLFGTGPYSFKFVNLFIHLINGVCVFLLAKLLLRAFRLCYRTGLEKQRIQWIAIMTAALWLIHPMNLTPVLYVVQRMTSLGALFSLLAFIFYFSGRLKQFTGRSGLPEFLVSFGVFTPLAVLSKDNAILIPYLLLVTDWLLLRFKSRTKGGRLITLGLSCGAVLSLFVGLSVWDNFGKSLLGTYLVQPFTLVEHVLTETRVLWFYLKLIFIPHPTEFGLYHDDIPLSKEVFDPVVTFPAIAGLLVLFIGAVTFRKKAPVMSFAILFFLIGHSIESSIFSLEIAHEHRNYLPMVGLTFVIAYYGLHPRLTDHAAKMAIAGLMLFAGLSAAITANRALDWKDIGTLSLSLAEHHPHSARSNYEAGRLFSAMVQDDPEASDTERYYILARRYFTQSYRSDEYNPSGLFGILYLDSLIKNPTDAKTVAELGWRLSNRPVMPAISVAFTNLYECYEKRICHLDPGVLITLYESALSNPRASKQTHASLFNELAMLKLEQGDEVSAAQLFRKSIELNPTQPQLRFNLVHVLITTGRLEEAQKELKSIREKFPDVREEHKLMHLEKMFANASRISNY